MAKKKPHELPRVRLRREKASLQLGGEVGGNYLPPGAQYEYNPPSVFAEYRVLSAMFALIAQAALLYWVFWPVKHPSPETKPAASAAVPAPATPGDRSADPVYVEPIAPR